MSQLASNRTARLPYLHSFISVLFLSLISLRGAARFLLFPLRLVALRRLSSTETNFLSALFVFVCLLCSVRRCSKFSFRPPPPWSVERMDGWVHAAEASWAPMRCTAPMSHRREQRRNRPLPPPPPSTGAARRTAGEGQRARCGAAQRQRVLDVHGASWHWRWRHAQRRDAATAVAGWILCRSPDGRSVPLSVCPSV